MVGSYNNNNDNQNNYDKKKRKKAKIRIYQKKNVGETEKVKIEKLRAQYENIDIASINTFEDFPLSQNTLRGLQENDYKVPTEIQKQTIGLTLRGTDVLGAAQTGSGKTLAFLIPILEILYCNQWTRLDGLGALVITPTRELAYQIFETLRKVGTHHDFSAGLIIGGKDLKFERKRMDQCNIVIGTPGRILQHMDENPLFDCVNMQVLVLDEADRCLDMGFEESVNAIIANLPPKRQTLLFSATQTKSVKDLVRLSLKDPTYVSVHEHKKFSTPENLQQSYVVCELQDKISILWSFIRNHTKKKIVVFFASCKQVKYVHEIFTRLRAGVSLLGLYSTLHQLRRLDIYQEFCSKSNAVLLATDLAARGLDFPNVDWVIQFDCPEDGATYIHRVGRTARYNRGGESLLMLLETEEEGMCKELEQKKIPINKIEINPKKLQNPVRKMEAFLAKHLELKDTAQRAFVSYVKAVFLMKNKNIFKADSLDLESFAQSLGLAITPRVRFLERRNKIVTARQKLSEDQENSVSQNSNYSLPQNNENFQSQNSKIIFESSDDENEKSEADESTQKSSKAKSSSAFANSDDEDGDVFTVKRRDHDLDPGMSEEIENEQNLTQKKVKVITKAAAAKKVLKKKIVPNKKIIFDDEGEAVFSGKEKQSQIAQEYEQEDAGGIDIEKAKLVLREEDKFDRQRFREKIKAKHKEAKRKLKEQKRKEQEEEDDFGSESEGDVPDMSWLPDPDKIYGKKDDEDAEDDQKTGDDFQDSDQDQEMYDEPKGEPTKPEAVKRKAKAQKVPKDGVKKMKKTKTVDAVSASLSVNEAEELALMLLKNK